MNPLTNVKNLQKLNERELRMGFAGNDSKSWHQKYKDSAWIFVGGMSYDLSEGDIIAVFSQYGEIVNINLIRDKETGKSRGFCFICYEDQRSTNLAVDNLNGIKVANRILRVDHVEEYKIPKERGDEDDIVKKLHLEGCAPEISRESTKDEPRDKAKRPIISESEKSNPDSSKKIYQADRIVKREKSPSPKREKYENVERQTDRLQLYLRSDSTLTRERNCDPSRDTDFSKSKRTDKYSETSKLNDNNSDKLVEKRKRRDDDHYVSKRYR